MFILFHGGQVVALEGCSSPREDAGCVQIQEVRPQRDERQQHEEPRHPAPHCQRETSELHQV